MLLGQDGHINPCPSAVSLQYICSVSAVSTSCALDRPAVHKGYYVQKDLKVKHEVKYVLKCSEVHTLLYWDCTADGHGKLQGCSCNIRYK